jgi:nanoRNase/pAp phosphatase (c-di-AMP/oligoRNAs hydrolase)
MDHHDDNLSETTDLQTTSKPEIMELLEAHRGECHLIVLHDFPDPDAISSALAHQFISQTFDIQTDILYGGRISHQQNIALVRLLGIEMVRYERDMDLSPYDAAIFVDHQGAGIGNLLEALAGADVPVLLVVDHHEVQERVTPQLLDLRRTGSTATIYSEYLEQGIVPLSEGGRELTRVATALTHGIMTDTGNFIRAHPEDFRAAAFLSRHRDADLLSQIMAQSRSKQTMEVIYHALENRVAVENFSIAGIGYLRINDRDAIPQAADFLLTEENVHTSLVYGIVVGDDGQEALVGSMRTSRITIDPDEFIKKVVGKDAAGNYFGGGKVAAGAFEVPIGFLAGEHREGYQDLKWQVYDAQIKQKIFSRIGVEREPEG